MGDVSSLYPQPPAPSQANFLTTSNPAALAQNILSIRGQQISNAEAQFRLAAGQNQYLNNALGTLASKSDVSMDDVRGMLANVSRNTGIDSGTLAAVQQAMPDGGPALQRYLQTLANSSIGSTNLAQRVTGPIDPYGRQTQTSLGASTYAGTYPTGLAPGVEATANLVGGQIGQQGVDLGKAADGAPVRKAMLGNLESDLQNFTSGQGADWQMVAKAWANRNVLPQSFQFSPQSIASQEAFNKQAEQLAQQQFQSIGGTGTDAKFGSAFKSNPNDALSQLGNQGIIRLLQGNEDALIAKNRAWQAWQASGGGGPGSYQAFSNQFNSTFDPRVYQSQYMSKPDFVSMVKSMSPAEQSIFRRNLQIARSQGYAGAPGSTYGGN